MRNPSDVKVDTFLSIWGATVIYGGIPLLVLFAIFLHPEIVPRRSKVKLTLNKPFIQII